MLVRRHSILTSTTQHLVSCPLRDSKQQQRNNTKAKQNTQPTNNSKNEQTTQWHFSLQNTRAYRTLYLLGNYDYHCKCETQVKQVHHLPCRKQQHSLFTVHSHTRFTPSTRRHGKSKICWDPADAHSPYPPACGGQQAESRSRSMGRPLFQSDVESTE